MVVSNQEGISGVKVDLLESHGTVWGRSVFSLYDHGVYHEIVVDHERDDIRATRSDNGKSNKLSLGGYDLSPFEEKIEEMRRGRSMDFSSIDTLKGDLGRIRLHVKIMSDPSGEEW